VTSVPGGAVEAPGTLRQRGTKRARSRQRHSAATAWKFRGFPRDVGRDHRRRSREECPPSGRRGETERSSGRRESAIDDVFGGGAPGGELSSATEQALLLPQLLLTVASDGLSAWCRGSASIPRTPRRCRPRRWKPREMGPHRAQKIRDLFFRRARVVRLPRDRCRSFLRGRPRDAESERRGGVLGRGTATAASRRSFFPASTM
jgi:hypothetical protein